MSSRLSGRSTEDLVSVVSQAEREPEFGNAVAELVLRFKGVVFAQALHICRHNQALADDVFQETFMRVFQFLRDRRGRPSLYSFAGLLKVLSRRAAIDIMRREDRAMPTQPQEPESWEPVDDRFADQIDVALYAKQLLDELDDRERKVIQMSYLEGMNSREIAERLNLKPGYVRQIRFRALERIRMSQDVDRVTLAMESL